MRPRKPRVLKCTVCGLPRGHSGMCRKCRIEYFAQSRAFDAFCGALWPRSREHMQCDRTGIRHKPESASRALGVPVAELRELTRQCLHALATICGGYPDLGSADADIGFSVARPKAPPPAETLKDWLEGA